MTWRTRFDRNHYVEAPASMPTYTCWQCIHDAMLCFPGSIPVMYLKAIVCQLMWAEVGPLRMKRLDVLEEGLDWLRRVRQPKCP
jgi:hypothetical protein